MNADNSQNKKQSIDRYFVALLLSGCVGKNEKIDSNNWECFRDHGLAHIVRRGVGDAVLFSIIAALLGWLVHFLVQTPRGDTGWWYTSIAISALLMLMTLVIVALTIRTLVKDVRTIKKAINEVEAKIVSLKLDDTAHNFALARKEVVERGQALVNKIKAIRLPDGFINNDHPQVIEGRAALKTLIAEANEVFLGGHKLSYHTDLSW